MCISKTDTKNKDTSILLKHTYAGLQNNHKTFNRSMLIKHDLVVYKKCQSLNYS